MSIVASKQFSLQWRDISRGLIMAVLSSVLTLLYDSIQANGFDFDWQNIAKNAAGAAIIYLFKNGILEPPKVIVPASSNLEASNVKEEIKEAQGYEKL